MTTPDHPFEKLRAIVARLRDPKNGCPWDLEQTHQSLKPFLIEEAYEVLDAIDNAPQHLSEELGDVLLQVMLHSQLSAERNEFSVEDVVTKLADKLVSRHPHVFGPDKANNAQEAESSWERSKLKEKDAANTTAAQKGIFDDISKSYPALIRAFKIGKRSARINFDFTDSATVWHQLELELEELRALDFTDTAQRELVADELGDLLFTAAQLARKLELSPEEVLNKACDKFIARVAIMETLANKRLDQIPREELEQLWKKAKAKSPRSI